MLVWRICRRPFADLSGEGGRLHGGRWNSPGRPIVYAADTAALAVFEVRVHLDLSWDVLPDDYVLMAINIDALGLMLDNRELAGALRHQTEIVRSSAQPDDLLAEFLAHDVKIGRHVGAKGGHVGAKIGDVVLRRHPTADIDDVRAHVSDIRAHVAQRLKDQAVRLGAHRSDVRKSATR